MGMWHALGMLITSAHLDELRKLHTKASRGNPFDRAVASQDLSIAVREFTPALLDAAESLLAIRAIAAEENDLGDFSRRVGVVLAALGRE